MPIAEIQWLRNDLRLSHPSNYLLLGATTYY
jgi:hypothetical protein